MTKALFHPNLIKIYHAYNQQIRPYMTELELSDGQPKILAYISLHDGCLQKDLADWYAIKPATVSRLLNHMEDQGLITRETPEGNRRITKVYITKKGTEKYQKFAQYRKAVDNMAFQGFTEEERTAFIGQLDRIRQNLL